MLRQVMQFSTLCVAKRTQSVRKGMRRRAPHDNCDDRSSIGLYDSECRTTVEIIVPHSSVGMQFSTLCVAKRTQSVRKGMRRGAPHDNCDDRSSIGLYDSECRTTVEIIVPHSSVGMQFSTLCVAKRTQSVRKGIRRRAPHDNCD
ncbi:hypothetical protein AO258_01525 [Pseudomonas syringae ICMP 19498]|nr:hypothetical protein AO258_01525 [Pseudomonas syringae ICMP 19498]